MGKQRIQKALGAAGVASRRAVEEMIVEGRITVNGKLVTELPCFVDLSVDEVRVDSRRVRQPGGDKLYFLLNKPKGVVCTQRDPAGRPRATDLVPAPGKRVYCAGRLDAESTGLIILTNDGELTQILTHPSHGIVKTYVVEIDGELTATQIARLKRPSVIDGKRTQGVKVKVLRHSPTRSLLEMRLTEGRNREIRRILARLGHRVRKLRRVAIGGITEHGLKVGNWRMLRRKEVEGLRHGELSDLPTGERSGLPSRSKRMSKSSKPKRSRPTTGRRRS